MHKQKKFTCISFWEFNYFYLLWLLIGEYEREGHTTPIPTTTTTPAPTFCPDGWTKNKKEEKCYKVKKNF